MISLILPTYNRSAELSIFLNSVLNSAIEFEIIIVDQNDYINLEHIVSEYRDKGLDIVHIKESEKNLSKARNIGIANSKYDIIGFPDDDCYYETETLSNILSTFQNQICDIAIARWMENEFEYSKHLKSISMQEIISFKTCPLSSITIFARKKLLNNLNGFNIRLGVGQWFGAGEETDLIMRASRYGAAIIYVPNIIVHHRFSKLSEKKLPNFNKTISRSRGTGAIYSKNNLPRSIIISGFFSPLLKALYCFNFLMFCNYICIFYGRVSGYIKWNILKWGEKNIKVQF